MEQNTKNTKCVIYIKYFVNNEKENSLIKKIENFKKKHDIVCFDTNVYENELHANSNTEYECVIYVSIEKKDLTEFREDIGFFTMCNSHVSILYDVDNEENENALLNYSKHTEYITISKKNNKVNILSNIPKEPTEYLINRIFIDCEVYDYNNLHKTTESKMSKKNGEKKTRLRSKSIENGNKNENKNEDIYETFKNKNNKNNKNNKTIDNNNNKLTEKYSDKFKNKQNSQLSDKLKTVLNNKTNIESKDKFNDKPKNEINLQNSNEKKTLDTKNVTNETKQHFLLSSTKTVNTLPQKNNIDNKTTKYVDILKNSINEQFRKNSQTDLDEPIKQYYDSHNNEINNANNTNNQNDKTQMYEQFFNKIAEIVAVNISNNISEIVANKFIEQLFNQQQK